MKIKIILPVNEINCPVDFMFPENGKTPMQQVEWLKEIVNDEKITSQDEIAVVTSSPYIAHGLCMVTKPLKKGENFGEKEDVVFSDGEREIFKEEFFHHFAKAMSLLFEDITPC